MNNKLSISKESIMETKRESNADESTLTNTRVETMCTIF